MDVCLQLLRSILSTATVGKSRLTRYCCCTAKAKLHASGVGHGESTQVSNPSISGAFIADTALFLLVAVLLCFAFYCRDETGHDLTVYCRFFVRRDTNVSMEKQEGHI